MLFGAVTVLVVVAAGEPAAAPGHKDPTTRAMEKALRTALGADAVVTVRRAGGETDEQLLSWAATEHANLLGIVSWSEEQRRATLRFVHPSEGRWADREIRFDLADAPTERGRTVGFAFASMVPDDAIPPRAAPPPSPPPPAPASAQPSAEVAPPVPAPHPTPPPGRWSLEAGGAIASGINGFGGGLGGVIALRYAFKPPLSLRVAFGAREGDVTPASATARVYSGAAGLAWHSFYHRLGGGVRVDGLLLGQEMVHLSADDPAPAHLTRVVLGLDAAVEGSFRFVDQAAVFAGAGFELAFGRTDVYVRDRLVAELAAARLFGEAGIRVFF